MPSTLFRGRWLVALLAVAVVATGGLAYAAIPDAGGVIHSCYTKSSGAWRVIDVDAGQACKSNEAALDLYSKGAADLAFLDKPEADALYLGKAQKAADSDKLDGQDSSAFLGTSATAADSNRLGGFLSRAYVLGGGYLVSDVRGLVDSGTWSFGCCLPGDTSQPITFKFTCDTAGGANLLVSSPARFRWWWDDTFGEASSAASGYETQFAIGNGAERHSLRATELFGNSSTTLDFDTAIGDSCVFAWTHMKTPNTIPGP